MLLYRSFCRLCKPVDYSSQSTSHSRKDWILCRCCPCQSHQKWPNTCQSLTLMWAWRREPPSLFCSCAVLARFRSLFWFLWVRQPQWRCQRRERVTWSPRQFWDSSCTLRSTVDSCGESSVILPQNSRKRYRQKSSQHSSHTTPLVTSTATPYHQSYAMQLASISMQIPSEPNKKSHLKE